MIELAIYFIFIPAFIAIFSNLILRRAHFKFYVIFSYLSFFSLYYLIEESGKALLKVNYEIGNPLNLDFTKYNPAYFLSEPLLLTYIVLPFFCYFITYQLSKKGWIKYFTWTTIGLVLVGFLFGNIIVYFYFTLSLLFFLMKKQQLILQKTILSTILSLGLFSIFDLLEKIFSIYDLLNVFCINYQSFFCFELFAFNNISINLLVLALYLLWFIFLIIALLFVMKYTPILDSKSNNLLE